LDGGPQLCRSGRRRDLTEDLFGQRGEKVAKDNLILSHPLLKRWVGRWFGLLAINSSRWFKDGRRRHRRALDVSEEASALQGRHDGGMPHVEVAPGELL
jgi:hypothetical protein